MPIPKKTLIGALLLMFLLSVLRETGILTLNFYSSDIKSQLGFNWSNNTLTSTMENAVTGSGYVHQNYSDVSVIVEHKGKTLYMESNHIPVVHVAIDRFSTGFLWTPLFKKSRFKITGSVYCSDGITKVNGTAFSVLQTNISGSFTMTGRISVNGISSHREAIALIRQHAVQQLVMQARQYFSTLD
jgi:hypothetical protein